MTGDLDETVLARELVRLGTSLGVPCSISSATESTNDDARAAARGGAPHGALFLADAQTRGRGRSGHVWHSPPGENVYLSLLLRPAWGAAQVSAATLAVGVAVARVAEVELPASASRVALKWPNDVHCDGRKLAGILVEAQHRGGALASLVVGVGLNVRTWRFPPGLESKATSLALLGAGTLDRALLAARLVAAIGEGLGGFGAEGLAPLLGELARRDALRGRAVRVGEVTGTAEGIDAEGRLLLRREDGRLEPIVSGEAVAEAP